MVGWCSKKKQREMLLELADMGGLTDRSSLRAAPRQGKTINTLIAKGPVDAAGGGVWITNEGRRAMARMLATPERRERDEAIVARRAAGETLAGIARDFGLTRECVRQIVSRGS